MLVGMELVLGYDAFDRVLGDVRGAVDSLAVTRLGVGRDVAAVLDGGWSGSAADSFADAWSSWLAGAEQVEAALSLIASSLALTRRSVTLADDAANARSTALLERLG